MPVQATKRQSYLDVLRILASFLICYNHAFGYHLYLEQEMDGSLTAWANIFLSALTSINVPLFFMISGALLLGKTESYSVILRKRVWRIAVLLMIAPLLTHFFISPGNSFLESIVLFLNGSTTGVYWYLFSYISFLLLLPMVRNLAQHMSHGDMILLTVLRTILFPCLMTLNFWLRHWGLEPVYLDHRLQLPLVTMDVYFFTIAGYYLARKLPFEKLKPRHIGLCAAVLLTGNLLATVMTYAEGYYGTCTQDYLRMFGYSSAMAAFVMVRYAAERIRISPRLEQILANISSVTIGIYYLEPVVDSFLYQPFFRHIPWESWTITFFSVIWSIVCMIVGGTVTWLLRKIPGVKKYL